MIEDRQIMYYRCRNCGTVFNDVTGLGPDAVPVVSSSSSSDSIFDGLSREERIEKVKEILSKVKK